MNSSAPTSGPPRVCLLPGKAPSWPELAGLAELIRQAGWAQPVLILAGAQSQGYQTDCQKRELTHILLPDASPAPALGLGRRAWQKLRHISSGPTASLEPLARDLERVLAYQQRLLDGVLDELRPSAVITSDERQFNWVLPLISRAHSRGIPVLVPPVSYLADQESLLIFRQGNEHQAALYPELAAEHPQQLALDPARQTQVFFYTAPMTLALARQSLLPQRPWVPGGGPANLLLAEGEQARQRYLSLGAAPGKVLVTGQASHDLLYARQILAQAQKAAETPETPRRLLVSLPQLAEQGSLDWDCHWREIRFLAQTLAALPGQCLLALHPKMDRRQYLFLSEEYGLELAQEPLARVLPAAHVLAATFSSTVAWAVLCRLPTVVFDFYGLDFRMYDDLGGVRIVRRREQLGPELARLLSEPACYAQRQAQLEQDAAALAPFDGGSGQRILAAIRRAAGL